jgi:hypothetical protein
MKRSPRFSPSRTWRIPSRIAPRPNTKLPTPHDLKTSTRIGPPMRGIAADNRSIPVPDGFLVDICLSP